MEANGVRPDIVVAIRLPMGALIEQASYRWVDPIAKRSYDLNPACIPGGGDTQRERERERERERDLPEERRGLSHMHGLC